jgi:membrane fusion protein (multidrug efflux system)
VVHQREIDPAYELDDVYVIEKELDVNDRIVLEGILQVRDGQKLEKGGYEFAPPEQVLANQKNKAE